MTISVNDMIFMGLCGCWLLLVLFPITYAFKGEYVTFATYAVTLIIFAIIFMVIIPEMVLEKQIDISDIGLIILIALIIATRRWFGNLRKQEGASNGG